MYLNWAVRTLPDAPAHGSRPPPGGVGDVAGPSGPPSATVSVTRILVVDDHPITRQALARLVADEPDLDVVAEASTADDALDAVAQGGVDFVIADIALGRGSGLDLIGRLRARGDDLPVLVFSMHGERFYAERALRSGAQGYLSKRSEPAGVVPAIRKILAGELSLSPSLADGLARRAVTGAGATPVETLSDRETEVVRLIGDGRSTREIAEALHLSVKTVESYRANVKRKLNLRSGTELARFAYDWRSESIAAADA